MKINFPALFQTPINKYKFFFIFGNDKDVFERAIYFIQKTFEASVHIQDEKEILKAEPRQPSLFEPLRRTIPLVSVSDKILTQLEGLHEGTYIFTSEKARAASKLVTTFTESKESLAIAAYASPITASEFEFIVKELNLADSFKGELFKAFQNDYKGLLSTLAKIKLYGDISETHYQNFLESSSPSEDLTPLIHGFLVRDSKKVTAAYPTLLPADQIPFLRNLIRTFLTLLDLIPYQNKSGSIPWQTIKPPIFFKDQALYQTALSRWNAREVNKMLETLLHLEKRIKFSSFSDTQIKEILLNQI